MPRSPSLTLTVATICLADDLRREITAALADLPAAAGCWYLDVEVQRLVAGGEVHLHVRVVPRGADAPMVAPGVYRYTLGGREP